MRKTKIISLLLLVVMLMSLYTPAVSAEASFSDLFDVELSIGVNNGVATGTAFIKSLNGVNTDTHDMVMLLAFYKQDGTLCKVEKSSFTSFALTTAEDELTVSSQIPNDAEIAKVFAFNSLDRPTPLVKSDWRRVDPSLKVLAIGNSFSVDGMQYLYQIAQSAGFTDITLGNLYIGGCSLETHYNKSFLGGNDYTYYKNTSGSWQENASKSIKYGVEDEDWDIITMQQSSHNSGLPNSYEPFLTELINYVKIKRPNAKLGWHMTWAYQADSTHSGFNAYSNNQMTMYNAIVSTVQSKVLPHDEFVYFIPSGTAIQNARTSYIGDTLTRDGYHLSVPYGRYIAGLAWFEALTGVSVYESSYVTGAEINDSMVDIAYEAVSNAIKTPLAITNSTYTEEPFIDFENDYTQLDIEFTPYSYWFSTNDTDLYLGVGEEFNSKFISTGKFTKEDLPNGTLIVVDGGWQYRPEGWQTLNSNNTSARPGNVSVEIVEVDDEWWGNFTVRAFNLSKIVSEDISQKVAEAEEHFRIYVPKNN